MNSFRLFFVGGLTSYRALFYWLSPTIYIPSLIVAPIFQILLFAYIGRSAGLQSDVFYVTGNAIQYAAIPCLFAMSQTVSGERYQNTLHAILVSPAKRFPLFVGRALPVMGNAAFVSAFSFAAGCVILGVSLPAGSIPGLAVVILVAAFSCTGLGLTNAAVSLRVRAVRMPGELADARQNRPEQVRLVHRRHVLHHRREALEAHARVDVPLRERRTPCSRTSSSGSCSSSRERTSRSPSCRPGCRTSRTCSP